MLKSNSLSVRERDPASAPAVRVGLYLRVSTADQNCELQLRDLQEYVARQGGEIMGVYQDVSSGAKSARPALNRLLEDARARKFDCLLVWKLDRFGRSLVDCLNNIQTLEDHGIRFIAVTQGLDTDQRNPASRFLLHVLCLHRQGLSLRQIARQLRLGLGTVSRTLKACSKSTCSAKDGAPTSEWGAS